MKLLLQSLDADTRQQAASRLGEAAREEDCNALLAALPEETSASVRAAIVTGLGKQYVQCAAVRATGTDRLLSAILPSLKSDHVGERMSALRALGWIGDRRASSAVTVLLQDAAQNIWREATATLGGLGETGAVPGLITTLQSDADLWTRYAAASALRRLHDPRAFAPLRAALDRDNAPEVRSAVAQALGELKDREAIPVLIAHLQDADGETRYRVVKALVQLRASQALPALEQMAREDHGQGNGQRLNVTATNAMRVIRTGRGTVDAYDAE